MAASHRDTYTLNVSMQQLCDTIRGRDFADKLRMEIKSENPTPTGVWYRFHHGATFTSWGEKITITLTPLANNMTQVEIHSECGMPTQVVDWGKNKQVVCNVYEYLEANAPRMPASPVQYAPVQPVAPVQPAAPVQPVAPVQPAAPVQPMAPVQPSAPVQPMAPVQPVAPVQYAPAQPMAQPAPRFCTSCGAPIDNTSNFCGHCGAKLR